MGKRLVLESQNEVQRPPAMNQPCPWLVMDDSDDDCRQIFYSLSQNRCYIRRIPEMQNKFILSSQQGWWFLEENVTNKCLLYNMSTKEKLQLPPLGYDGFHMSVVSSSGTKMDKSCRILVHTSNFSKVRSCYLGDGEYREIDEWKDSYHYCGSIKAVVNYKGKLYALSFGSWYLSVADFADPELYFTPVIRGAKVLSLILTVTNDTKCYLVESNGTLLFVYTNRLNHDGLNIKIFKADLEKKEWVEECLGDRALFLDDYKGFSSAASEFGLRSNCVYYVNSTGDKNLYIYDFKDGSVEMFLPPYPTIRTKNPSLYWAI